MKKGRLLGALAAMTLFAAGSTLAQSINPGFPDPYRLTEPKNFEAFRATSNNEDWNSNDDSKRPIPGETTVLADLQGPGVVTHMWITIADNEYGWPRLLRLRVYYDGSPIPSVDAPLGDFFAVGQGFEAKVKSLMVVNSSDGRARNSYWPMPFQKSCRITVTNEGRRRVVEPLLPRRLGEAALPAREHSVLPRALPPVAARARRRLQLRVPEREGEGPLRRHGALRRSGGGRVVRRGRRVLLGGRREEALDRGHGQRGLLQRRLGTARQREPVLRRHGGRGHGPRLAHDGVPLAPARSGAVSEVPEVRHRAQGLDVQCRRLGQVGLRRARGPDVERRVLVPGGHRGRPAAGALRRRAPAAGQRSADRGRARHGGHPIRQGQGVDVPRPLLVQGRRDLRGRRPRLHGHDALRRAGGGRLRALRPVREGLELRHLHRAPRRQAAGGPRSRARAGRGRPPADAVRRVRARDLRRRGLSGRLAAAHQGPPHADLPVPRQARGLERLRRRRRRHRAREDRSRGLGRGREDPGAAQSDGRAWRSWRRRCRTRTR